jgi:nucleoside phosphorylase
MISVLLVEDNQAKISAIASAIESSSIEHRLAISMNVVDAKRELQSRRYDLLLLDINLPKRPNANPEADGGLEILRWLKARGQAYRPPYIVGVTAFKESYAQAKSEFDNLIWRVVSIDIAKSDWAAQLTQTVSDIESQIRPPFPSDGATYRTDVLVVTALQDPELSAILELDANFERIDVRHDASPYFRGRLVRDRQSASVVAVAASDKGLSGAAIAATKGICTFWPRYVYMTGITAGVKGRTSIGDVIFADLSWDWGSGKLKKVRGEERFLPAPYQRRLDESLSRAAKDLKLDAQFLSKVHEQATLDKPSSPPKILVGAMASGASVLQSSAAVKKVIDQHKDLLAIEMEAFSVMFAAQTSSMPRPQAIVAKAVSDAGDRKKNDEYQKYAAYTSAKVFEEFTLRYIAKSADD